MTSEDMNVFFCTSKLMDALALAPGHDLKKKPKFIHPASWPPLASLWGLADARRETIIMDSFFVRIHRKYGLKIKFE